MKNVASLVIYDGFGIYMNSNNYNFHKFVTFFYLELWSKIYSIDVFPFCLCFEYELFSMKQFRCHHN